MLMMIHLYSRIGLCPACGWGISTIVLSRSRSHRFVRCDEHGEHVNMRCARENVRSVYPKKKTRIPMRFFCFDNIII